MALSIFYNLHSFISSHYKKYRETHVHVKVYKAGEFIKWPGETKNSIYINRINLNKQAAYLSIDRSTFSSAQRDNLKRR